MVGGDIRRCAIIAASLVSIVSNGAFAASLYNVTDLGTLPGFVASTATAINNSGQIVGSSFGLITFGGNRSPLPGDSFLYSGGSMTDLGVANTQANAINQAGVVAVAPALNLITFTSDHSFLYNGGTVQDIGTLGGLESYAAGINNNRQVVGWANTQSGNQHAFLYTNSGMSDLGTLAGWNSSFATAINDQGEVVGYGLGPGF